MTAAAAPVGARALDDGRGHARARRPLSLRAQLVVNLLRGAALTVLVLVVFTVLVGALVQNRTQDVLYDRLRSQLAEATAPVGPGTPLGEPVALLQIPDLGLSQVVVEGTASPELRDGPGHRPDTVLPGQAGLSVLAGRALTYGAPFRALDRLRIGAQLVATTGQGQFVYRVIAVRRDGDRFPPPLATGASRITLVTAYGRPLPTRALYVDADLVGKASADPGGRRVATPSERSFGTDPSVLYPLVLQLQLLLVLLAASVWFARRIGRWQAWLVGFPVLAALGVVVLTTASGLLPNLI